VEPINAYDRPGYFVSRSDEVAELLTTLRRDNVKMMFDVYHVQIMEGDILRRMERHWPLIGHVQFASVPGRHEPDEGELAIAAVFEALGARGWRGFVGAEYNPRGATRDGLGWLAAARR
jgi:hydroxypyruvate isomerase